MATVVETEIVVVGTGPTGLAAALALARGGAETLLVGPAPHPAQAHRDTRTAALLGGSVEMLKALGAWPALQAQAAPLRAIRIIDDSGGFFRSPEIEFRAQELGLDSFGFNIANAVLVEALYEQARLALSGIRSQSVQRIEHRPERVILHLSDGGSIAARLVVGADGRNSICRIQAGIAMSERQFDQAAIAASFSHAAPHGGISVELHRHGGSVTTVPLVDPCASSLVWIGGDQQLARLMRLDDRAFARALEQRLQDMLGAINTVGPRSYFPVSRLTAERLGARRTALIGEAAHVLPPIGAQGLNLGLRDAATLADCVAAALSRGEDLGGEALLNAYDDARRLDVLTRTYGMDLLSRSLLSGFLPLQVARGFFTRGLNAVPALRRFVMRIGMEPPAELPSLMRSGHR